MAQPETNIKILITRPGVKRGVTTQMKEIRHCETSFMNGKRRLKRHGPQAWLLRARFENLHILPHTAATLRVLGLGLEDSWPARRVISFHTVLQSGYPALSITRCVWSLQVGHVTCSMTTNSKECVTKPSEYWCI